MEELAAIYGFEPNEEFSLLNIKIPTLSCVVAPNEVEKDYYLMSPPKSVTGRRPSRSKLRTPAVQPMLEPEEMLGNVGSNALPARTPRPPTDKRQHKMDRPGKAHGVTPNPPSRNNRRREMTDHRGVHESDISNSQPELDAGQVPPTISDLLARNEDQMLFFACYEFQWNYSMVSDFLATAGIYKSPEACHERMKAIENIIGQAQTHMMCPRGQGSSSQGAVDDSLMRRLKHRVKESVKNSIPEMLAGKFIQHTSTAHKKRCLKMKKAVRMLLAMSVM